MARKRFRGVRSPSRKITLKRLQDLERDNFVNPATGLELSEGESRERIQELQEAKAERSVSKSLARLSKAGRRTKSGRRMLSKDEISRWVTIKKNKKLIRFPIKRRDTPFL